MHARELLPEQRSWSKAKISASPFLRRLCARVTLAEENIKTIFHGNRHMHSVHTYSSSSFHIFCLLSSVLSHFVLRFIIDSLNSVPQKSEKNRLPHSGVCHIVRINYHHNISASIYFPYVLHSCNFCQQSQLLGPYISPFSLYMSFRDMYNDLPHS